MFGEVHDNMMVLNQTGKIVEYHWRKLPKHFTNIELDQFQIMPNHFHGIIHIVGAKHLNITDDGENVNTDMNASPLHMPHGSNSGSLGAIIQNFNSVTSRK